MRDYLISAQFFQVVFKTPVLIVAMLFSFSIMATSQTAMSQTDLQALIDRAAEKTLATFASENLATNQLAITLIDLRDLEHPVRASYRGDVQIYPASVVKLFYLVAAHRWMEDGKLADTPELRRAMHDMIVDSLTGTTSGPEMSAAEMEQWWDKRNAVNRYYTSLGYTNINVNKKPWCEGPYGREKQALSLFKPTRNWLTTDATARLLADIAADKAVTPARCAQMKELLHRDLTGPGSANYQAKTFSGAALPAGAKLWSKAGWTSEQRHDAAYVELPNGARFVLVTFTEGHANEHKIISTVAGIVVEAMSGK